MHGVAGIHVAERARNADRPWLVFLCLLRRDRLCDDGCIVGVEDRDFEFRVGEGAGDVCCPDSHMEGANVLVQWTAAEGATRGIKVQPRRQRFAIRERSAQDELVTDIDIAERVRGNSELPWRILQRRLCRQGSSGHGRIVRVGDLQLKHVTRYAAARVARGNLDLDGADFGVPGHPVERAVRGVKCQPSWKGTVVVQRGRIGEDLGGAGTDKCTCGHREHPLLVFNGLLVGQRLRQPGCDRDVDIERQREAGGCSIPILHCDGEGHVLRRPAQGCP